MYAMEYGDDRYHEEPTSRDTYDAPVSPAKPLYHKEDIVEQAPLLPSVENVSTMKCKKTTFQRGLMEEHTPPNLPDIKDHRDEVRNIKEQRDEIRGGSSSNQNFENSRLPPPHWKLDESPALY